MRQELRSIALYCALGLAWLVLFVCSMGPAREHFGEQYGFLVALLWPIPAAWIVGLIVLPFAMARIRRARRYRNRYIAQEMRPD